MPNTNRNWYMDGSPVTAGSSTRRRIDAYELGLAASAAIELEEEFPSVAVATRIRLAESIRSQQLAAA